MIQSLIDEQGAWFEAEMDKILRRMRNVINSQLNVFTRQGGNLLNTTDNMELTSQMYLNLTRALNEAGYTQLIANVQAKENDLLRHLRDNRPRGAVPISFTAVTKQKIAAMNNIFNNQFAGVGEQAMRQISGIILDSVSRGGAIDATLRHINDVLDTNFKRYAVTYMNTSRGNFIQDVEYAFASEYDGEPFWEYQGPDDDVTRPACQVGLGIDADASYPNAPFYTDEERIRFESETAEERMYNCRHDFILITERYYKENIGG